MDALLEAGADPWISTCVAIELGLVSEVGVLLEFNCPLFQPAIDTLGASQSLLAFALYTGHHQEMDTYDDIISLIIKAIAKSRRQLMDLATQKLSSSQLGLLSPQIRRGETLLDKDASWVVDALEAASVVIPPFLWPGDHASIYHHRLLRMDKITELFNIGFCSIDVEDACGLTPAIIQCYSLQLDEVVWFLSHGARSTGFLASQPLNLVDAVALQRGFNAYCRHILGSFVPLTSLQNVSLGKIIAACNPTLNDTCDCPCSSHGCSTMTFLFKRFSGSWRDKTGLLSDWLQATDGTPTKLESNYAEICRREAFERLGMAHVCCQYVYSNRPSYGDYYHVRKWLNADEEQELRDEDEPLRAVLEIYMQLYKDLRKEHSGPFLVFWDAWWDALTAFPPERIEVKIPGYHSRWEPVEVKAPQRAFDSGGSSISWASYGLDGQIRDAVRSRLGHRDGEDDADIFADAMACLFQGGDLL